MSHIEELLLNMLRRALPYYVLAWLAAADPWQAAAYVLANEEEWTTERMRNAVHPVGGPLYPPVSAFFNAPLALMPARTAYRVQQSFNLLLAFVAAGGAAYLARGRVW